MELVNQTAVPARLLVSEEGDSPVRFGMLFAKATYALQPDGRVELVSEDPFPLFDKDVETELGLLPADLVPRRDPVLEVILLGAAYGPEGREIPARQVELSVGAVRRALSVTGDRRWESRLGRKTISEPMPFQRMPLTYDRAFGGRAELQLDAHTVFDVEDRLNKHGRGFDGQKLAEDYAAGLGAAKGFPIVRYERLLPNLENPAAPVARWQDAPEPYCWAAIPPDIGFRMIEALHTYCDTGQPPAREEALRQAYHRAHPDWIIPLPPREAPVTLVGLTPAGRTSFRLPPLRIVADYVLGDRRGARDLTAQLLVLLPEQQRFYLVYRTAFTLDPKPGAERSFRLRLERGWSTQGEAAAPAAAGTPRRETS